MTTRQLHDTPPGWVNALKSSVEQMAAATLHYDTDDTIAATLDAIPVASNEATLVTLANGLKAAWNAHAAATTVHAAADATNTVAADTATDTASANTLINELKDDFNAHVISTTYHRVRGDREITTADGSNEATGIALANDLQRAVLDHLRNGMQTLPACTVPGAVS